MNAPTRPFTAVILAAGRGSRLEHLTESCPKPLIKVGGVSLIRYAIKWAEFLGATKIVVVGGYMIGKLREEIRGINSDVAVVENPDYMNTQRLVSLLKAANLIDGDLYIRDADYIFASDAAKKMEFGPEITIFGTDQKSDLFELDMGAKIDEEGNLITMEKNAPGYKYFFCTQIYCTKENVKKLLGVGERIARENPMAHVEDAIVEYARRVGKVKFVNLGEPLWIEIDNLDELKNADKFVERGYNIPS